MSELMFRVHKSPDERHSEIKKEFRSGGVKPAYAISCQDGILMVTVNSNPRSYKIKKIFDRIVFAGVGNSDDHEKLYASASAFAKIQGNMKRSPGDLRTVDDIMTILKGHVRELFRDLFRNNYMECEFIIAVVGFDKKEDRIYSVDFSGHHEFDSSWLTIPVEDSTIEEKKFLYRDDFTMKEALRELFAKGNLKIGKEILTIHNKLFIEVVILSREEVVKKIFEKVYRRLNQEEIKEWLDGA